MGKDTKIEWAHHTFNPWWGCQKVSPACDHCYAEAMDRRTGGAHWGPHAERRRTSESYWRQPLKWNAECRKAGIRKRVFCASMADVFDNAVPAAWRDDLWRVIAETPHLDWLLLTKRPQNIAKMLPDWGLQKWGAGWPNVWLGTTIEDMESARQRLPVLQAVPARVHFVSAEPLLSELQLRRIPIARGIQFDALTGHYQAFTSMLGGFDRAQEMIAALPNLPKSLAPIDWVICGGESGPGARPMHPDWARDVCGQCQAAGVPYLFKQWGEWAPCDVDVLPDRFTDPRMSAFTCISSCGHKGNDIGSAFLHNPLRCPDCFPQGEDSESICNPLWMIRVGKRAAGRLLDGREWNEVPELANAPAAGGVDADPA